MSRVHSILLNSVCVAVAACAGCSGQAHDQRFQQKTAERRGRIDRVADQLAAREAEAPQRLATFFDVVEVARVRHQTNLQRTLELLEHKERRDRERWPKSWAKARDRAAHELAGDPENIDAAIPRLFY